MPVDPFTQVLNALWDLFEERATFTTLVRLANRIKLTSETRDAYKDTVLDGDLPEVVIEPAGGEVNLFATSTDLQAIQRYAVRIVNRDLKVNDTFFPLKWEVTKAFLAAGDSLGAALPFVRKVRLVDIDENVATERDEYAWRADVAIEVELWFNRSKIETY